MARTIMTVLANTIILVGAVLVFVGLIIAMLIFGADDGGPPLEEIAPGARNG